MKTRTLLAIIVLALLTGCAHRRPLTYKELSEEDFAPKSGYEDYLP